MMEGGPAILLQMNELKRFTLHLFPTANAVFMKIDLNSGALKKRITLFHYYPEKVRVYNDFVYYLYDVSSDPDNKMLYRQRF